MDDFTYMTVQDVVNDKRFPFKKGQMRMFLSQRKENGLDKAVRKIGKRLYLRLDLFINWVEDQNE